MPNSANDIFSELLSILEVGERLNREYGFNRKRISIGALKSFALSAAIQIPQSLPAGTPQNALQFTVPANMAFLCTYIGIKALQPQGVSLELPTGYPDDFGGLLTSEAWITQDGIGNPVSLPSAIYLGLANRPCCFLFNSGVTINLIVELAQGLSTSEGIFIGSGMYGWMGGSDQLQIFQSLQTVVGQTMGYPGGSGGGHEVVGPTGPGTGNAPY